MALTATALASRALIKLGAAPIAGFEDGTAEAEVAAALYQPVREALLAAHPWSFATRQAALPRLAGGAADGAHAFQLPSDLLRVLSAGTRRWRIHGRRLETAAPAVSLTYLARIPESEQPAFFEAVLIARLAAEFCLPLTESTSRAELLARQAEEAFRRARFLDAQQDTAPALSGFPLIEVRHA